MARHFFRKRPYAEMHGEPGVAYLQEGNFFDKAGVFVRESDIPEPEVKLTIEQRLQQDRMEQQLEMAKRASPFFNQFNKEKLKPLLEEIDRENRMALAAEYRGIG